MESNKKQPQNRKKKGFWLLLLLLLFLLIGLGIYFLMQKEPVPEEKTVIIPKPKDTVVVVDTTPKVVDTVTPIKIPKDTVKTVIKKDPCESDSTAPVVRVEPSSGTYVDSVRVQFKSDDRRATILWRVKGTQKWSSYKNKPLSFTSNKTIQYKGRDWCKNESAIEEVSYVVQPDPCKGDTIPPWIYPEPSGGLHFSTVRVTFKSTKKATIWWRFKGESQWNKYDTKPITIATSNTLEFKGEDGCKNTMAMRSESYEIGDQSKMGKCPQDMVSISVGGKKYCIDRYEWPNKKGARPTANVSYYQAEDSCFVKGKRLCSTEEWIGACEGEQKTAYPYGDRYEPRACVTEGRMALRSGQKSECRSYFGVFDMSGNLAEWTSTKSDINDKFFNVMGGLWESSISGTCNKKRYSYYPQNSHNPVGFRCCKNAE